MVKRLQNGRVPQAGYNLYEEWSEWFSSDVMQTPLRDIPETKASFLPSVWEKKKVSKMVHAIKTGWMKPRQAKPEEDDSKKFYMLWQTDDQVDDNIRRIFDPIPAPKMKLPGHEESYNPPPEYLFTEREKKEWEKATEDGFRRKLPFIPQKYSSLRKVPAWTDFCKVKNLFSLILIFNFTCRLKKSWYIVACSIFLKNSICNNGFGSIILSILYVGEI